MKHVKTFEVPSQIYLTASMETAVKVATIFLLISVITRPPSTSVVRAVITKGEQIFQTRVSMATKSARARVDNTTVQNVTLLSGETNAVNHV